MAPAPSLCTLFGGVLATMVAPVLSQSKLLTLDKCDAAAANQVFGYLPTNTSSIVGTVISHAFTATTLVQQRS
jgi:hypothetical protein